MKLKFELASTRVSFFNGIRPFGRTFVLSCTRVQKTHTYILSVRKKRVCVRVLDCTRAPGAQKYRKTQDKKEFVRVLICP